MLVPRDGAWGERVAALLRAEGAEPVIANLIAFGSPPDPDRVERALAALARGDYDWVVVTSAATAATLEGAVVPNGTRVAAVGRATATALRDRGLTVDFVPEGALPASGLALAEAWNHVHGGDDAQRVLALSSDLAAGDLASFLTESGHSVDPVVAYRTLTPPVTPDVVSAIASGRVHAILITSGSVARAVAAGLAPLPSSVTLAAIGPRTRGDAQDAGLAVNVTSSVQTMEALVETLAAYALVRDHTTTTSEGSGR